MFESIYLYKLIATLLITNSHMGPLYGRFDAFAIGGALGNTFFFIASGFLASTKTTPFVPYMKKRVFRIWPAVIVVTIIMYFIGELPEYETVGEILRACVFPTAFWFVNAIIICYILFYITNSHFQQYQTHIILGFLIAYLIYYLVIFDLKTMPLESGYGKVLYLFPAMLIGEKMKLSSAIDRIKAIWLWGAVFFASSTWLFFQLLAQKYPTSQILVPFSSIAVGILFLELLLKYEEKIRAFAPMVKIIMHEIANATLEIYLVQVLIIRYMAKHIFPTTVPVTFVLIISVAIILRRVLNLKKG